METNNLHELKDTLQGTPSSEILLSSTIEKMENIINSLTPTLGLISLVICLITIAVIVICKLRKKTSDRLYPVCIRVALYSAAFSAFCYFMPILNILSTANASMSFIEYLAVILGIGILGAITEVVAKNIIEKLNPKTSNQE